MACMDVDRKKCKGCGAQLGEESPEGLCPRCLLKVAMETQLPGGASGEGAAEPPEGPDALPDSSKTERVPSTNSRFSNSWARAAWGPCTRRVNPDWTGWWP